MLTACLSSCGIWNLTWLTFIIYWFTTCHGPKSIIHLYCDSFNLPNHLTAALHLANRNFKLLVKSIILSRFESGSFSHKGMQTISVACKMDILPIVGDSLNCRRWATCHARWRAFLNDAEICLLLFFFFLFPHSPWGRFVFALLNTFTHCLSENFTMDRKNKTRTDIWATEKQGRKEVIIFLWIINQVIGFNANQIHKLWN